MYRQMSTSVHRGEVGSTGTVIKVIKSHSEQVSVIKLKSSTTVDTFNN